MKLTLRIVNAAFSCCLLAAVARGHFGGRALRLLGYPPAKGAAFAGEPWAG